MYFTTETMDNRTSLGGVTAHCDTDLANLKSLKERVGDAVLWRLVCGRWAWL